MRLASFTKHITPATLVFGTAAGVIGLLFAKRPPFTFIAAAILIASVILSIYQHYDKAQSDEKLRRDESNARQMLRKLVFSIPLGEEEREGYRKLVYAVVSTQDYDLRKVTSWEDKGGWISSVMYFAKGDEEFIDTDDAAGVIVISPKNYATFATLSEDDARTDIQSLLFDSLVNLPFDDALQLIAHAARILVLVETEERDQNLRIYRNSDKDTAAIVVGDTVAVADRHQLQDLLQLPGIQRDRHIIELIRANSGVQAPSRAG
jgi:hypothetical protein